MYAATASLRSSRPVKGSQLFASSSPIAARVASSAASGGRDVCVEVLEAKDVGAVAGRRGDAIDVKTRDLFKTSDAHCRLPTLTRIDSKRGRSVLKWEQRPRKTAAAEPKFAALGPFRFEGSIALG